MEAKFSPGFILAGATAAVGNSMFARSILEASETAEKEAANFLAENPNYVGIDTVGLAYIAAQRIDIETQNLGV